jgi:hypothetical protein
MAKLLSSVALSASDMVRRFIGVPVRKVGKVQQDAYQLIAPKLVQITRAMTVGTFMPFGIGIFPVCQ